MRRTAPSSGVAHAEVSWQRFLRNCLAQSEDRQNLTVWSGGRDLGARVSNRENELSTNRFVPFALAGCRFMSRAPK